MQSLYQRQVEALMGGLGVAPPGKLAVMKGDIVRVTINFNYRGSALNFTLFCAIGNKGITFDEKAFATKTMSLPASADFLPYTAFVDISTAGMAPQANYDLYAKLIGLPGADLYTPYYLDIIDVMGAPEFQNFVITDYSKV